MNRETITRHLKQRLEPLGYINAFWYEGADANGSVDEYSDIDYYVDFDDAYEIEAIESVENALKELGELDFKYVVSHGHPKLRQRIYHIKNTSPYLVIDFCWQLHSRNKEEYTLIEGDNIEAAKVIFDKANIIRYKPLNLEDLNEETISSLSESDYRMSQYLRVIKYVRRGMFPEAYAYYNRYIVEPLVKLLRIIHTPAHIDYYLVHISSHLPTEIVDRLEDFLKIKAIKDIEIKTEQAIAWYKELLVKVRS